MSDEKKPTRSKAQIEADMAAARARLANSMEELIEQVHPKSVMQRSVSDAKALAKNEIASVKGTFQDDDGGWRADRLAIVGGAVAGVIALFAVVRAIASR